MSQLSARSSLRAVKTRSPARTSLNENHEQQGEAQIALHNSPIKLKHTRSLRAAIAILVRSGGRRRRPRGSLRSGAAAPTARAPSSPRATINAAVEKGTIDTREGDAHRISGSVSYWWKGGGDGSVHSSVVAPGPQGLAAARSLRRKACATPKKNTSVPKPEMYEPIDEM